MKRSCTQLACAAAFLALASLSQGAPPQSAPFTLTLEAPRQPLKAGKPMILRVTTRNTGDQIVQMPVGQSSLDKIYQVHVLDAQGKPAPRRPPPPMPRPGSKHPFFSGGSARSTSLEPGKSATGKVTVSKDYDLRPGRYRVWIAEPIGPDRPGGVVKSNTVIVTVVK